MREPVDITQPTPVWGNPGFLLNGPGLPVGPSRRCEPCDVRWYGDESCWSCEETPNA